MNETTLKPHILEKINEGSYYFYGCHWCDKPIKVWKEGEIWTKQKTCQCKEDKK